MNPNPPNATPPEGGDPLPNAVYIDTNALFSMPKSTPSTDYEALRAKAREWHAGIFTPDVAYQEWKQKCVVAAQTSLTKVQHGTRELSQLLTLGEPPEIGPGELERRINEQLARVLQTYGITVVPTPVQRISLEELLSMAVRKKRPFEEKGEKGFRDAVILMTITDHMNREHYTNALLVSGDDVFDHSDVLERLRSEGLRVVRAQGFAAAADMIEKAGWFAIEENLRTYSLAVCAFANSKLDTIWTSIRRTATVLDSPVWSAGSGTPRIERILGARPLAVKMAFPVSGYGEEPEVADLTLVVELDVIAEVTPRRRLFSWLRRFSLSAEDDFGPVASGTDHVEMERTTVTRDVFLRAELSKVNGEYSELRVRTTPHAPPVVQEQERVQPNPDPAT